MCSWFAIRIYSRIKCEDFKLLPSALIMQLCEVPILARHAINTKLTEHVSRRVTDECEVRRTKHLANRCPRRKRYEYDE